jgi:AsmA protein
MGKFLKFILWLLLALLALLAIAAVVLPMVVDPNDYKADIAKAVEEQTGRTLTIEGDISLSVFPWLGLDIGPTQFSNAAGFDEPSMARMQTVQVRVKLLPLLHKQLEVDKIRLSGLQLHLAKDKQGVTNWADLTAAAEPQEETAAPHPADRGGSGLERLAIGGIEIKDATIRWDDQSTDSHYVANIQSLTTGAIVPGEAFDLDLQMQLSQKQPLIETGVSLRGELLVATDFSAITITAAKLQLDAQGDSLPAGQVMATLTSDIAVDLAAQTLTLPNIVLDTLGLHVTAAASGTGITTDAPAFKGTLAVAEFVPRKLFQGLGEEVPVTADDNVLQKANAELSWDASLQHFAASALTAHLDETSLTGEFKVKSFAAPAITFTLSLDQIDLDRYLPPAGGEEDAVKVAPRKDAATAEGTRGAGTASAQSDKLPLEPLRQLDLNGDVRIARFKAFNLSSHEVQIQIRAKDGVLNISPLAARLYEGTINADVKLDARKDTPRFSVKESLSGVQAGPLLKDLTGDDKLLGTAMFKASLEGAGDTVDAMIQTLNGTTEFSFTDGAIKGVNIAALIRAAQAQLEGQPIPKQEEPNQTDYALLRGTATVTNGLVKNNDLFMESPLMSINGAGEVSLPKETIDYTLTTKLVGSLQGWGGKYEQKLKGVSIPVHVGGTFSKPTYTPDLASVMTDAAKAEVGKRVEKEKEKLEKKLGTEIPDSLLKGLFDK